MDVKPLLEGTYAGMQRNFLFQRRRGGAVALALVALLALFRLRSVGESPLSLGLESVLQGGILVGWLIADRRTCHPPFSQRNRVTRLMVVGFTLVLMPWVLQLLMRSLGEGTGLELVAMSSFAWATLLATVGATRNRSLGTSVVCSGFMTLLATCSSDHAVALILALLWGGLCLWWLASSQWERAQRCQVSVIEENRWQRPIIVLAGSAVFALSAWSVAGRFPPAQRLPWEIAPTSGGTSSKDEFARSGVGDGDALVAAREHAASFGAVDSDLMLDSDEASLFDLYSDAFGEPVRKLDVERTVALAPQQQEMAAPNEMAQSDGASSALTTQRCASALREPLTNRASDALLFWIGRPDTHLALERFSKFDGVQWHSADTAAPGRAILPMPMRNQTWFGTAASPATDEQRPVFQGALPEAVKYARLRSPRIPATAGMHSWHINQVDDGSFFHMDSDDNLSMTGRKCVPEYTVVRYIGREIDLQTLSQTIVDPVTQADNHELAEGETLAREIVLRWIAAVPHASNWEKVAHVVDNLREQFRLNRAQDTSSCADPLANFFQDKSGNDLMFATAAAVMLEQLGYETRLVTGLVARSENRLGWTQELAVYAQDTHAWLEIQSSTGDWIPLEPTPGFPLPVYRISWHYWLKLNAWRILLVLTAAISVIGIAIWQRIFLFECLVSILSLAWWMASDRQRCQWLVTILDIRSRLVGYRRPTHVTPRLWYSALLSVSEATGSQAISVSTAMFFRDADRMWFGNHPALSPSGREACRTLWTQSKCRLLRKAMRAHHALSKPHSAKGHP